MKKYKQLNARSNLYRSTHWFANETRKAKRLDYTAVDGVSNCLLMAANLRDSSYGASKLTAIAMLESAAKEIARAQTVASVATRRCTVLTKPKKLKRR
jgi:hypothetical protein